MVAFIAKMIIKARQKGLEQGQAKYRAYFIKTRLYADYQLDVNAILVADDCADCIVAE